jgi:hypothetical protein
MAFCPFKKTECTPECLYFAPGVKKCSFPTGTMLFEDLHKLSLVLLDNAILKEEKETGDKK